jgi:hypothetical protein
MAVWTSSYWSYPTALHAAAASDLLGEALTDVGMSSQPVRTTVVTDDVHARERGFPGSPTFLINGVDPFAEQSQPAALPCPAASTTRPPTADRFPTPHDCATP